MDSAKDATDMELWSLTERMPNISKYINHIKIYTQICSSEFVGASCPSNILGSRFIESLFGLVSLASYSVVTNYSTETIETIMLCQHPTLVIYHPVGQGFL